MSREDIAMLYCSRLCHAERGTDIILFLRSVPFRVDLVSPKYKLVPLLDDSKRSGAERMEIGYAHWNMFPRRSAPCDNYEV